jgi:hypothetical protein
MEPVAHVHCALAKARQTLAPSLRTAHQKAGQLAAPASIYAVSPHTVKLYHRHHTLGLSLQPLISLMRISAEEIAPSLHSMDKSYLSMAYNFLFIVGFGLPILY